MRLIATARLPKVEFFANSILVGTATTAPYAATWSNVAGGSYSITAKATDNLGASVTSSAVSILVRCAAARFAWFATG
jgi:chitinase